MNNIKISWLGLVNRIIFQWFFVRLTKHQMRKVTDYNLQSYDIMPDGEISSRGVGEVKIYQWWSFQYWVLPLSGWSTDYKYLNGKPKFLKLTKEKSL
jgi:hypothetical protein